MTTLVTQPLRDEHKELLPEVESLRKAAEALDAMDAAEARPLLEHALEFLQHHLIPHADAEDRALYPVVGRVLGARGSTATMSRDHVEVGRMTSAIADVLAGGPSPAATQELRRLLYGLYAIVTLHFAKEEEVYLPLLDRALSDDEAAAMFQSMEAAAAAARS